MTQSGKQESSVLLYFSGFRIPEFDPEFISGQGSGQASAE